MTFSAVKAAKFVANIGFVLLFPGFLLYHLSLAALGLPPFLGGLYGFTSAVLVIPLGLLSFKLLRRLLRSSPLYVTITVMFFIYVLGWTAIHFFIIDAFYIETATIQAIESLVLWLALFFIGVYFDLNSSWISKIFWAVFIYLLVFLAYYVIQSGNLMFYARQLYGVEYVVSYQGFARSMLVVSLFLLARPLSSLVRFCLIWGSMFILFVLGARSEFYGFILLLLVLLPTLSVHNWKYGFLITVSVIILAIILSSNYEYLVHGRQFAILNLQSDSSYQARKMLETIAINQITKNPLIGCFGGHIGEAGSAGSYAHNLLSSWVSFGLMGFLFYIAVSIVPAIHSFIHFLKKRDKDPLWMFSFEINFVCFILILAAKSVFWPLPALGWGVYLQAQLQRKFARKCNDRRRHSALKGNTINNTRPSLDINPSR